MGKKGKKKRGSVRGNAMGSPMGGPTTVRMRNAGTISFTGSTVVSPTLAVGANVLSLNPSTGSLGGLCTQLANIFAEYRFKALEIICHPGSRYAVAYIPETLSTPPTTVAQASQFPNSIVVEASTAEPLPRSLYISRETLIGDAAAKWWKCIPAAAADDWDEVQGIIDVIGTAIGGIDLEIKYHVQFTNAGLGLSAGLVSRRSIVRDQSKPIIDLYIPDLGDGARYPPSRKLEEDWKRVSELSRIANAKSADKEAARLALL